MSGEGEHYFNKDFDFTTSKINWQKKHFINEREHLPIEIARGCIFKCKFCNYFLNGKKLWDFVKSPETLYDEMSSNFDKFGTTGYMYSDDTYNDSTEKIRVLKEQCYDKLPFNVEFSTYARADLIISNPEQLDILMESGLKAVLFGIETFNSIMI